MPNTSSSVFPGATDKAAILMKEVAGDTIEVCVTCGEPTPYKQNTHIDLREHYVEGAGQLCKRCWDDTYNSSHSLING
tara:strand:+ start:2955 stop:3188 length:234 start_codon:yes stop_codon:yes gene_type:complete